MIKTIYNESFSNKNKYTKINNHFIFEKTLTPIKIIPKDKIYDKESNTSGKIKKTKTSNNLYIGGYKNYNKNKNNIKLKILNYSKKNSRNFSSLNGLITNGIFTKSNFISINTNNSLSLATNLKTTMDSNITKTQIIKDKINKENSSFIESKTITFFSSLNCLKNRGNNQQIKNISQIKKMQKIKLNKSKSNNFINIKKNNNNKISNYLSFKIKKNNERLNKVNKIYNNKSFIFPKRINILKNLQNNYLTPIIQNNKIKYKNSLSLNKNINKIENNINIINKKQKLIDINKISIKKSKLKNIYMLLEKQKESICIKDKIKKENNEIEKINDKLKKFKDKTLLINNEAKVLNDEIINNKEQINIIKENIKNILNDKKNVNTMIILLHRRIIDIKKRIKEHDEENYYLDKSFYELSLKYKGIKI
jgi:hypothetical protein